ncbi:hypothetical protein BDQ17DRAFT_1427476 [Cyathus striatus]|nr:hypothetical protein BDQ17DRAFT_1427476 [Cyathus striatus]
MAMLNVKLSVTLLLLVKAVVGQDGSGIDGLPACATTCAETAAQAAECTLYVVLFSSTFVFSAIRLCSTTPPDNMPLQLRLRKRNRNLRLARLSPEDQPAVRGILSALCSSSTGTNTLPASTVSIPLSSGPGPISLSTEPLVLPPILIHINIKWNSTFLSPFLNDHHILIAFFDEFHPSASTTLSASVSLPTAPGPVYRPRARRDSGCNEHEL